MTPRSTSRPATSQPPCLGRKPNARVATIAKASVAKLAPNLIRIRFKIVINGVLGTMHSFVSPYICYFMIYLILF